MSELKRPQKGAADLTSETATPDDIRQAHQQIGRRLDRLESIVRQRALGMQRDVSGRQGSR